VLYFNNLTSVPANGGTGNDVSFLPGGKICRWGRAKPAEFIA
jgi:hypothetical protein